jgi:hypothetical protein
MLLTLKPERIKDPFINIPHSPGEMLGRSFSFRL